MPKYKLPALKQGGESGNLDVAETTRPDYTYPDQWERTLRIPINQDIIDALEIGGEATVTLQGTVESLSASKDGRTTLEFVIAEVDAYPVDGMSDEDSFNSGFSRSRGEFGRNSY